VHVPDMLAMPHILSGRRYQLVEPPSQAEPQAQYLALYELDTDNPQAALEQTLAEVGPKLAAAGRMSPLIAAVSMTTYTALGARQEATALPAGD
jgi:hypothetical protein